VICWYLEVGKRVGMGRGLDGRVREGRGGKGRRRDGTLERRKSASHI
jgi:hypothetical protein